MSTFRELINAEEPLLVDFSAVWCGPCKMMEPILKEVVAGIKGKGKVIKVDIDKNPQAAQLYRVQSVPTLIIFKKGEVKWRQSGVVPAGQLIEMLRKYV